MLTLPIKRKWFDMIASGEKKEEYRQIKPYYHSRFKRLGEPFVMRFRAGYSKGSPLMECRVIANIRTGVEAWGAIPGVRYYVLSIIKIKNITTNGST
jgi:hypothetical protein